jgi:hypothetical protein
MPKKKKKKRKNKGLFSKVIVCICITEVILMQIWGMCIADKDKYDTQGLIAANHAVFGGELLFLCLKRIFAKGDKKDGNIEESSEEIVES